MEQVAELVMAALPAAGEKKAYSEVLEAIPAELRAYLPKALKILKASGSVRSGVDYDNGVNFHYVVRL